MFRTEFLPKFLGSFTLLLALTTGALADQPLRQIQFGPCVKQAQPTPIFETMRRLDSDLLLFLGDNIYADTEDMQVMRIKYDQLGANESFQRLCRNRMVMATWDDHDFGVNDGGASYPKRDEAAQEFRRFWRVPDDSDRAGRRGVYDARVFGPPGKRVQIILLDTRYFRSELTKGTKRVGGPYVPDHDRSKTMLGPEQWKWLERQLRMPAELRLIASSIQFVAQASGQETWSNLPAERTRMIEMIRSTEASGVLFVSGDRHWAEISMTNEGAYPLYDATSSSFNQIHGRGTPTENRFRLIEKTYHRENFGTIEIDWNLSDPLITINIADLQGNNVISKQLRLSELDFNAKD